MGRSIVYCDKCGLLLKEEDFRQGKASTADNRSYCAACRPTVSTTSLPKVPAPGKISTSRIPKQPQHESRRIGSTSPPPMAPPAEPPKTQSNSQLLMIGGGIGVVVVGILAVMMSGSKPAPRQTTEETTQTVVMNHPPPPVEKASPEERALEESARAASLKAYQIRSVRPNDLAAQWRAFEEYAAAARGSSYAADATGLMDKLRRRIADERAAIEAKVQEAMGREDLKGALGALEAEAKRYDMPEWTRPAASRLEELRAEAERRLAVAIESASDLKRRNDEAGAKNVREKFSSEPGIDFVAKQLRASGRKLKAA